MEKLKMESPDLTQKNIEKIAALFPNVITEIKGEDGQITKGINYNLLKQELSADIIDSDQAYEFTWVGKNSAIVEANKPIRKTLRPCLEESKDWENTGNLFIEGDNLDVLKLLQESYLNSIKMIYIDPPYNTGNDFIYKDTFIIDTDEYNEEIGYRDDDGNIQFKKNDKTNPRYHSDWCTMLFPRLKLAHSLLTEDGVIFISIDDNEVDNLKKMCNEVFGENNFVNQVVWVRNSSGKTVTKQLTVNIEYLLIYAKTDQYQFNPIYKPLAESTVKMYSKDDNDGRGKYRLYPLQKTASPGPETTYDYIDNNGKVWKCPPKGWRMMQSKLKALENDGRLCLENDTLSEKAYWNERDSEGKLADTLWNDIAENNVGSKEISNLFGASSIFSNPKPTDYVIRLLNMQTNPNSIILDFFSGSSTTAHAVMQLNAQDGGNRKFIMVQLPEDCKEDTEAYKLGYKNICEIGKDRIRKAGEKIKNDFKAKPYIEKLDTGFRVLKLDTTNMKDVYYAANKYTQQMLLDLESNIKEDRSDLDLLYGVLLDWGLPLSLPHKIENINGTTVHTVDEGSLVACFAQKVSEDVVREIAKRQPLRVVFRDSGFTNSPDKINVEEIFKLHAPNTTVKVI